MKKRIVMSLLAGAVFLGLPALAAGCAAATTTTGPAQTGTTTPTPTGIAATVIKASHGDITIQQLAEIQPGLGTVMVEYGIRFNNMWFAAQKGNWDMVHYQILEMKEIQEVGETTRPGRAPALKSFEAGFLDPIDASAQAKDVGKFTTAYDSAIAGCNSCHATSSSSDFKSYKFVKVTRPSATDFNNVDWAGQ